MREKAPVRVKRLAVQRSWICTLWIVDKCLTAYLILGPNALFGLFFS